MYKGLDLTKITIFDLPNPNLDAFPFKTFLSFKSLDEMKESRFAIYANSPAQRAFDLLEYADSIGDKEFEKAIEHECKDIFLSFFRV